MSNSRIGIILLGGSGTRFAPTTKAINKHLIPVFNKPMFFYSLSTLMMSGINKFVFVTDKNTKNNIKKILSNGRQLGLKIDYALQNKPLGIVDGIKKAIPFIKKNNFSLILGDNFFYGEKLPEILQNICNKKNSTIITYHIENDLSFGFLKKRGKKLIKIYEKPKKKISNNAVTGLYFYNNDVIKYLKNIKPSKRGELEITDLNNLLIKKNLLNEYKIGRGIFWIDAGTPENLILTSDFVKIIENRIGLQIGNITEISYRMKFVTKKQFKKIISSEKNIDLRNYLKQSLS